ncbi:MFS transporter [Paraburkholderia sp. NPDC080076]|uniref:MFS transporter n=1 Tax=Paraburkholderia sp. NPDC080076 TaxID=3390605 RepID=UPI003CFD362E
MNQTARTLDVGSFIDAERFSPCQWMILVLCFLILAADGFDAAAIGFIAPSLVSEWGIERGALGSVMSAALVGLGVGALLAGPLADRFGRKAVLVLSVAFFGAWSLIGAHAHTIGALTVYRLLAGLGLGASLPNAITLMSEYAPARLRGIVVNAIVCGFSCGLVVGGVASSWLIPHAGWSSVLTAGGVGPLVLALLLFFLLPESVQFLAVHEGTHRRIARILRRIAPQQRFDNVAFVVTQTDTKSEDRRRSALALVMSRRYLSRTLLLWLAYFMGCLIYYLLTNWMPTLFRDAGFSIAYGALLTSLFPLGGMLGTLTAGWLMDRFNANRTIVFAYVLAAALVLVVGWCVGNWPSLLGTLVFLCGMVVTSAATSTSAYAATLYPTEGRATGVAWTLGVGRIGAVAGAFLGAALLGFGWRFGSVFGLLALPALAAAGALYAIARGTSGSAEEFVGGAGVGTLERRPE